MLTFDSGLATILAGNSNKTSWCNALITALGSTRTLRAFRDSNGSASNPFNTGTEFLNVGMTGAMTISAGVITGLGVASGFNIHTAADLSTGASCLRIEGNGHFVQGSLGLTGSGADFTFTSNPTTSTGVGFAPGASISPYKFLPSGVGPAAPSLDSNAPFTVELWDWSVSTPALVGSIAFDTRIDDLIFEDSEMATEMGDTRVTQSSQSIIFNTFEFGATMFSMNPSLNADANVPLHQVVVAWKPYGRWSTYPFADTFNVSTDASFPNPFKIIIKKASGTTLGTLQLRDGLPINSPSAAFSVQMWGDTTTALRPHMNCGMMAVWTSHKTKVSSNAFKWCNGVTAQTRRPSLGKQGASTNGAIPLASNRGQANSVLHYYAAPQWPIPFDPLVGNSVGTPAYTAMNSFEDTYLYNVINYHGGEGIGANKCGWDYEPGSISCHEWYTGPGGPRFDRAVLPTPYVMYCSDPTGNRIKGTVPWRTACEAYNLAYFNHSHHWFTNVKTLATMPNSYAINGEISFGNAYYGNRFDYVAGGTSRSVDLQAIANGGTWPVTQPGPDGHYLWNGWTVDQHHSYTTAGLAVMFFNSPMHVISAKTRFNAHIMGQLVDCPPGAANIGNLQAIFLTRVHAWRLSQLTVMWKIATQHSFGFKRSEIEQRFQAELEAMYDQIYVPAMVTNVQDAYNIGLRNLGCPANEIIGSGPDSGKHWLAATSDAKTFYMSGVLALMKQTGCWSVMRQKVASNSVHKCQLMLDFIIASLDKWAIDYLYYGLGRYHPLQAYTAKVTNATALPALPTDWNDWATNVYPRNGSEDIISDSSGALNFSSLSGSPDTATAFFRFQYVMMRRDFFPEYTHPRLTATCTLVQGWHDRMEAYINGLSGNALKGASDLTFLFPPQGIYNAPTVLGAA